MTNETKGASSSTSRLKMRKIRNQVLTSPDLGIQDQSPVSRLRKYVQYIDEYRSLEDGRNPTQAEVIKALGGSFSTVVKAFDFVKRRDLERHAQAQRYTELPQEIRAYTDQIISNFAQQMACELWVKAQTLSEESLRKVILRCDGLEYELAHAKSTFLQNAKYLEEQLQHSRQVQAELLDQVTALTVQREALQSDNTALNAEVRSLIAQVLKISEKR